MTSSGECPAQSPTSPSVHLSVADWSSPVKPWSLESVANRTLSKGSTMSVISVRRLTVLCAASIGSLSMLSAAGGSIAGASPGSDNTTSQHPSSSFHVAVVLEGASLHHKFLPAGTVTPQSEALSDPDDITRLDNELFVGFQNGVGPQGQASTDGNLDSTVVEFSLTGQVLGQWDVTGKTDGVTADPALGGVIATVNEDANSALYTIRPFATSAAGVVTRYTYNE